VTVETYRSLVRRLLGLLAIGSLLLAPALPGAAQLGTESQFGDPYFPTLGNTGYDVRHYDLALTVDRQTRTVRGAVTVELRPTVELRAFTFDLVGFDVAAVEVDGTSASVSRPRHKLRIVPRQPLAKGKQAVVRITYSGRPSAQDLTGWYWFPGGGALFSPQPSGASRLFPCNERPSDKATFAFEATTRQGTVAVANGLLERQSEPREGWVRFAWRETEPFPVYAAVVAVGRFRLMSERSTDGLPIINAFPRGSKGASAVPKGTPRRLAKRLRRQGEIIATLEKYLGPYPYSSAGAIVTTESRPDAMEAASRPTYPGVRGALKGKHFEQLVAHELAHQWLGDAVTLARWRDIWLNEGFATYGELLWIAESRDIPIGDLFQRDSCCFGYYKGMKRPPGDPGPDHLFSVTVYNRGALTLEALRRTVGDDAFYRILREWVDRNRGGNVNTRDFIRLSESIAGRQLDGFFQRWLYEEGLPNLPPRHEAKTESGPTDVITEADLRDDAEFRGHKVG
jgi:aminopeptidase N